MDTISVILVALIAGIAVFLLVLLCVLKKRKRRRSNSLSLRDPNDSLKSHVVDVELNGPSGKGRCCSVAFKIFSALSFVFVHACVHVYVYACVLFEVVCPDKCRFVGIEQLLAVQASLFPHIEDNRNRKYFPSFAQMTIHPQARMHNNTKKSVT